MKLLKVFILIIVALLCVSGCKNSKATGDEPVASISGKVIRVLDGDTIKLQNEGTMVVHTVRLSGIDAPEKKQAYGREAQLYLSQLIDNKNVVAFVKGKDKYGRYIARIEHNNIDVNAEMVRAGLAWHYAKFDGNFHYAELMHDAVGHRRGLWKDKDPVMPEKFRKLN